MVLSSINTVQQLTSQLMNWTELNWKPLHKHYNNQSVDPEPVGNITKERRTKLDHIWMELIVKYTRQ